jgi:hypothetical protein
LLWTDLTKAVTARRFGQRNQDLADFGHPKMPLRHAALRDPYDTTANDDMPQSNLLKAKGANTKQLHHKKML